MFEIIKKNMVNKVLTDEIITPLIEGYLNQFPVENGEIKNVIICSIEKDGKARLAISGLCYNQTTGKFFLSKIKKQMLLVQAAKELINKENHE